MWKSPENLSYALDSLHHMAGLLPKGRINRWFRRPFQTVCWLLTISGSLIPLAASQLYFGLHFSARDANLRTCCAIHRLGFWHVLEARRTFGMDVVGELEAERKSALKRTSSDSFWPRNERLLWLLERQNSSPTTSIPTVSRLCGTIW